MVKWINKAGTFLREKIGTSLGFVILAALLLELLSFVQFYHTRSLLRDELQKRMEKETSDDECCSHDEQIPEIRKKQQQRFSRC